jgi:two-component system, cell cycle sensor histidine kinase and response regulator CckA
MNHQAKTKAELIQEISVLQQRIIDLENSEAGRKRAEGILKLSDDTYREIFNTVNDTIWVHDIETGQFLDVNNKVTEMFGYSVREAINLSVEDISSGVPPFIQETAVELLKKAAAGEPQLFEWHCKHKDGHLFWTEVNLKQGTVAGKKCVLAMERDITERKRLEAQLIQAQKLEAIGTLSGGMAHNFNNILNGIQGFASLIRVSMKPDNPHYEWLKFIEEQVSSGAELTMQLLDFSRGGNYEMKPLDINQLLSRVANLFRKAKREVVMHMSLAKDTMTVLADQNQVEQVILNLFVNASQAMPSGGNIHLETQRVFLGNSDVQPYGASPGAYVKISVSDTGVGMDEKTQERIFEPFFTTKPVGQGTGLGLSSVYGIIKGHRGFINVDSKLGNGTTFTIYLPATEKEAIVAEKRATTEVLTGTETIMVVDDEKASREAGKAFLESLGYRVYVAGSGQEAMAVYMEKRNEIDLVLLDMIMPGISGGETFDRLREINPDVRVLLCSGYSIKGEAQKILERGSKGFLQKPFKLEELSWKIRKVLADLDGSLIR